MVKIKAIMFTRVWNRVRRGTTLLSLHESSGPAITLWEAFYLRMWDGIARKHPSNGVIFAVGLAKGGIGYFKEWSLM